MLPVINGEINPPYDNPCPTNSPPKPPKILSFNMCKSWDNWDDFLADPNPSMSINLGEVGTIVYPLNEEWRNSIIKWHDEIELARAEKKKECSENKSCDRTVTLTFTPTEQKKKSVDNESE